MGQAWQVTECDITIVLNAHNTGIKQDTYEFEKIKNMINNNQVEGAILYYTDFDDQCNASLSEIEDILIENNIVDKPKKFIMP